MSDGQEKKVWLPMELGPWLSCPKCGMAFPLDHEITQSYFKGDKPNCANCGEVFDWWELILRHIREDGIFLNALAPVGARSTVLEITLRPTEFAELKMEDHGIPTDARILQIGYTPQGEGGLFPAEFFGNVPPRHLVPHTIRLYPVPIGKGSHTETRVAVMISWVPHTRGDYAWQNLVDAFEAFVAERYETMVIPANVAVESTLGQILSAFLEKSASRDRVKSFLEEGATYGHQLNVILPNMIRIFSLPPLPDHIRGLLNRLRELRNEVAHRGFLEKPPGREEAAQCLCAALFGFHYVNLVRPALTD